MFHAEKFVPGACPKCERAFRSNPEDFVLLLGRIVDGEKVRIFHRHFDIVVCSGCGNHTARVMIEQRRLATRAEAERLVREEGFTLVSPCLWTGPTAKEERIVHPLGRGIEQTP